MKRFKQTLSHLGLNQDQILSRVEMKSIIGGQTDEEVPGDGGTCLTCEANSDCARVNKGECKDCTTHGKKCCSGWHSH